MRHKIIVGNIGLVEETNNVVTATKIYADYIRQSRTNYGRAAGEDVTWFKNDEIYKKYIGNNSEVTP